MIGMSSAALPTPASTLQRRTVPQEPFARLARHNQEGIKRLDTVRDFMKERAILELEYAHRLRRLVKWYRQDGTDDANETGLISRDTEEERTFFVVKAFNEILRQTYVIAGQHEALSDSLKAEVAQGMQDLAGNLTQERKAVLQNNKWHEANACERWVALESSLKAYQKAAQEAEKAHEKFQKADSDLERSRADVQRKRETHAVKTSEFMEAESAYKAQWNQVLRFQEEYENEAMPRLLTELVTIDVKRNTGCQKLLGTYVELESKAEKAIASCLEVMLGTVQSMEEDEETKSAMEKFRASLQLARSAGTGNVDGCLLSDYPLTTPTRTANKPNSATDALLHSQSRSPSAPPEDSLDDVFAVSAIYPPPLRTNSTADDPFAAPGSPSATSASSSSDRDSSRAAKAANSKKRLPSASKILTRVTNPSKKLLNMMGSSASSINNKFAQLHITPPRAHHERPTGRDSAGGDITNGWGPATPSMAMSPSDLPGSVMGQIMTNIQREEEIKAGLEKLRTSYSMNRSGYGDATAVETQLTECSARLSALWRELADHVQTQSSDQQLNPGSPASSSASSHRSILSPGLSTSGVITASILSPVAANINNEGASSFSFSDEFRTAEGQPPIAAPNAHHLWSQMSPSSSNVPPSYIAMTNKRGFDSSFSSGSDDHEAERTTISSASSGVGRPFLNSRDGPTNRNHSAVRNPMVPTQQQSREEGTPSTGQLWCKALYDFNGKGTEKCIAMKAEERFDIVEHDDGNGWTCVRRKNKPSEEGFVPTSYIQISPDPFWI